jgi:hypothetical protein
LVSVVRDLGMVFSQRQINLITAINKGYRLLYDFDHLVVFLLLHAACC